MGQDLFCSAHFPNTLWCLFFHLSIYLYFCWRFLLFSLGKKTVSQIWQILYRNAICCAKLQHLVLLWTRSTQRRIPDLSWSSWPKTSCRRLCCKVGRWVGASMYILRRFLERICQRRTHWTTAGQVQWIKQQCFSSLQFIFHLGICFWRRKAANHIFLVFSSSVRELVPLRFYHFAFPLPLCVTLSFDANAFFVCIWYKERVYLNGEWYIPVKMAFTKKKLATGFWSISLPWFLPWKHQNQDLLFPCGTGDSMWTYFSGVLEGCPSSSMADKNPDASILAKTMQKQQNVMWDNCCVCSIPVSCRLSPPKLQAVRHPSHQKLTSHSILQIRGVPADTLQDEPAGHLQLWCGFLFQELRDGQSVCWGSISQHHYSRERWLPSLTLNYGSCPQHFHMNYWIEPTSVTAPFSCGLWCFLFVLWHWSLAG